MTIDPKITDNFRQTMIDVYEDQGEQWLKQVPALLAECAAQWNLTIEPPYTLSYNYVAPAVRGDGTSVVLKMSVPGEAINDEIAALKHYDGHGMVQLIESDLEKGAFLMERLEPGMMLVELTNQGEDDKATEIAASVMRQLWKAPPQEHNFDSIADWTKGLKKLRERFNGGTGPLPENLVEQAEHLFDELLASTTQITLLHGDLHHYNILRAKRQEWLAIDPKGIVGDAAHEPAAYFYNPQSMLLEMSDPQKTTHRRVDQFADLLGLDKSRIRGWGLAHSVLSAWWSIEDHGAGWEFAIACAEWLSNVKV